MAGRKPTIFDQARENDIFESLYTLEVFPELPSSNNLTVCEINTEFQVAFSPDPNNPPGARAFTPLTDNYIPVTEDSLQPRVASKKSRIIRGGRIEEEGYLIKPKVDNIIKAAWDGWNDDGLEGALKELKRSEAPAIITSTIISILHLRGALSNIIRFGYAYFHPHLALRSDDLIQNFAPVRQWKRSWVRAVAWHPTYNAFALALNDDTIRVVANDEDMISLLINSDQRMISCLAWRPFTSELAVGVETGLLVWHVKGSIKPSSSSTKLHRWSGHCPITSLDFDTNGRKLVTSSANDNCLVIWNTDSWKPTPLTRIRSGGIPRARWSSGPDSRIFCTTPTSLFLIWAFDRNIRSRKWNTQTKFVEAFAWSPCGSMVLFVNDCILYSLNLKPSEIELIDSARVEPIVTPIFNLKVCTVSQKESQRRYKAGGKVLQIEWDPTGLRLAILFSDSELVAVFRVQRKPSLILIPCGFVRGLDGEQPVAIAFQKNFEHGAMLLIAWSSRRIQYFPLLFTEPSRQTNLVNQQPPYYINYRIPNLTSLSGLTSTTSSNNIPVDFGTCFYQQEQEAQSQASLQQEQRRQRQGESSQPSTSSDFSRFASSSKPTGPKLFSM